MIRMLNFFAFAATALVCLALYHVSEQTRVAKDELVKVGQGIVKEQSRISVLQTQWSQVAAPARIQMLAETKLGLNDAPVMELSSLTLLPRRGEALEPGNAEIRNASAVVPTQAPNPDIRFAAMHSGN